MAVGLVLSFARAAARNTRPEVVLAPDSPVFTTVRDFLEVFVSGSDEKYKRYLDPGLLGSQRWYYRSRMTYVKTLGVSPSAGATATLSSVETSFAPEFTPPPTGPVSEVQVLAVYTVTVTGQVTRYEDVFTVTYVSGVRGWRITDIRRVKAEQVNAAPGK